MKEWNRLTLIELLAAIAIITILAAIVPPALARASERIVSAGGPATGPAMGGTNIMQKPWYQRTYRRMLVDMHIPDWDEAFLSRYDPEDMAEQYQRANLDAVMFYCQSHVGLCYWPTRTGKMHAGLKGRDVVGELLGCLKKRNIAACAYYSVIFNNWAFLEHPEWRMQPAGAPPNSPIAFMVSRYGVCCPNNPGYRAFAVAQAKELVSGYDFDGFFYDMTFWPVVCVCPHCRSRYLKETGKEIPRTIDWNNPEWCAFQSARERWIGEFARDLTATVKNLKPHTSVYHNFATAFYNWVSGCTLQSAVHHDYLGADFYGGPTEQLMVRKLMLNLTENRPPEFMTSRCVNLQDHVRLKSFEQMKTQAFSATIFSSPFLFIDAINPAGTVNPAVYERIGEIYAETARYEPYLGGEPVEDIAVYFSSDSKMDFAENGTKPGGLPSNSYPHLDAVRGACRILQQAHVPFGVISRKQLRNLDQYRVVILPNLLRMDEEEVRAFRNYVLRGGNLYASRYTSLTETKGVRHSDFMLADVFGCHFASDDLGHFTYLKPREATVARSIEPQHYISIYRPTPEDGRVDPQGRSPRVVRIAAQTDGSILATLTLPYGSPHPGNVFDQNWASIHSFPPWDDTDHPVVIRHQFGKGHSIYSAAEIECIGSEASDRLFICLLRSLFDTAPTFSAETHPNVWMSVFHQPENKRYLIGFLNYPNEFPAVPIQHIPFSLRPPQTKKFTRLLLLPEETPVDFTVNADGALHAEVRDLAVCQMLLAETD